MKRIFITVGIIGLLAFTIWFKKFGPSATADLPDTIIIGTSSDFPPFSFRDNDNKIVGFDIDVANEVVKVLGKKILIEDMKFEMLLPELHAGNIHAIIGISENTTRSKKALFSRSYVEGNALIVLTLPKNKITKLSDLNGKDVAINTGYEEDMSVFSREIPYVVIRKTDTFNEAIKLLNEQKVNAAIASLKNLKSLFKNKEEEKYNQFIIKETDENFAFAVSKKYETLLPKIQKALEELEQNGTLKSLREKWKVI